MNPEETELQAAKQALADAQKRLADAEDAFAAKYVAAHRAEWLWAVIRTTERQIRAADEKMVAP